MITAVVKNDGAANAENSSTVTYYADERYIGAALVGSLLAGESKEVKFTWKNYEAADRITVVCDAMSTVDESDELNNTYTDSVAEGSILEGRAMPALQITGMTTVGTASFGAAMSTKIMLKNTGNGESTGAFKVSLFAQGILVGDAVVNRSVLPGAVAEVTVDWTANVLPTGEYALTALADSEYNIVMSSRAGVRYDATLTVSDGIAVSIENGAATLTQNNDNQVRVRLIRSDGKSNTDGTVVRVMVAGTETVSTAVYDASTDRYIAALDLSGVTLGEHGLIAIAQLSDMSDTCTFVTNVVPAISVTVNTDAAVYRTGDTVTVSGGTEGLQAGDTVEIAITGEQIWKYTAAVDENGRYSREITLPANAGGAMRVAVTVKNAGADRTASTNIYVYGVYFTTGNSVTVTAGDTATVKGAAENIGYLDLRGVTVSASARSTDAQNAVLPTVKFMSGGHAFVLDTKSTNLLEAVTEGISINGTGIEYPMLDTTMQIDASGCLPGDYEIVLTLTGMTDQGEYTVEKHISVTLLVPKAVMDITNLNLADDEDEYFKGQDKNPLEIKTSAAPGEQKTFSYRVVNLGTGNLTGLSAVLVDRNGDAIPWASLVLAGGVPSEDGLTTTVYPYFKGYDIGTAEGAARISVTFAPQENVGASKYDLTLIVSADDVETVKIPVTVYVSAHAIGTKVIKVVTADGTVIKDGKVTLYGPVSSAYSLQPINPQSYTGEIEGAVTVGSNLSLGGTVQFTNIPSGTYNVSVTGNGLKALTTQIEVLPIIDMVAEKIVVEQQLFVIRASSSTEKKIDSFTAKNDAYDDAMYQLQFGGAYESEKPDLLPDYPIDEMEITYNNGRITSRLAIMNSDLTVGDATHNVTDVTIRIDSRDIPAEYIKFRSAEGLTDTLYVGTLSPQEMYDFIWNLDLSALYIEAAVEKDGANYTLTLPEGYNWNTYYNAWNRENTLMDNNAYLTKHLYNKVSISEDGRVLTVTPAQEDVGEPDGRVPLYTKDVPKLYKFDIIVEGVSALEFAEGSTTEMKKITRTIPVQIDFIPNGYYLEDTCDSMYTTERLEGAFQTGSNAKSKIFSKKFLSNAGATTTTAGAAKNDDGFTVGFSQDIVTSEEYSKLTVEFENPSSSESIEELEFKVIISDMMPDENGKLAPGASINNASFYVSPSIVKSKGVKGWENLSEQEILGKFGTSNGIDVGTLLAGGSFTLDFELEPVANLYSNDMFTYLIDNGLMTIEQAVEAANHLRASAGTNYAWVEYSFKRNGRTVSGSTQPVMQKIKLPADLTSYEEVFQLDPDSGVYYAAIVITNSGFGTSDEVLLSPPEIPSLNGARYRLSSYNIGNMRDYPGEDATPEELAAWYRSWLENPVPAEIKLAPIPSGESIYIIYRIDVIGKSDGGVPPTVEPHPLTLPEPPEGPEKIRIKVTVDGKPIGSCTPEEGNGENAGNPARIADLIDQIADSLSGLMYSTVGDYGIRLGDAYTNAKKMQAAKVIVGVQRYLSYISTVVKSVLGTFGGHTTQTASLAEDDDDDEKSLIDQMFTGTLLLGAIFDMTDDIVGHIQPFMNSIKAGKAKEAQVETILRQLNSLGSMKPNGKVYAELIGKLAELDDAIKEYSDATSSTLAIYDSLIAQTGAGTDKLPELEANMKALVKDWDIASGEALAKYGQIYLMVQQIRWMATSYQQEDVNNADNYDQVIAKVLKVSDVLSKTYSSLVDLSYTVALVQGHINLNHYLRGDYDADFDKFVKDHKLELTWDATKAAYENEDIKDNYLKTMFKDQVDAIDKVQEVYQAKERFRKIKGLVKDFGSALGAASDQGFAATVAVLGKEGVALAKEFELTKPYAEFIDNTMKLIQLANEKDEMTKAMGAFGDATLRLTSHTYEAVRDDKSTGQLTKTSPLVLELMGLINEAINLSNDKAPGAFKALTKSDMEAIRAYLVEYLNVQRAKYTRSEDTDSNWMKAHISAVMAALFEQVYVQAITEQATPEKFLEFMRNADKVETKKSLNGYLDKTLEKQIFRDIRQKAVAKLEEAQTIVRHYSTTLAQNSSYPVKEIIRYLEDIVQKMSASMNIEQSVTRRYKDLTVWQVDSLTGTKLEIRTNYTLSYREYQKALLNVDVINAENMMVVVDYLTAGVYDLIMRSALMVVTMSPNAISASIGAAVTDAYDSVSEQIFTKLDDAWKIRSTMAAKAIAELSLIMGSTLMKEADVATGIYDLIAALDKAVVFDPPLDTELITYSIKDVVIPDGQASGTGEVLVTFRNDGDKTVAITPSVSIYTADGKVATVDFSTSSVLIPAGQTSEFIGTFTVNPSVLLDSTGYTAVLSYAASEPSTVSIAAEQGPFVTHFFAGTERQIAAMRNKVNAGTLVSGWVTGTDTLEGSITVKEGQSLRIFAAAPANGGLTVEIVSPSGQVIAADSFINDGDYAIIRNCEAGTYTVRVTTPENFDNRITVEGVVSSYSKAVTAVHSETEAMINCNKVLDDGTYYSTVGVSVGESAWIDAGTVEATLTFEDGNLTATPMGFDDFVLNAGGALNGGFVIKADPNTPSGVYKGTLRVAFDAETCDPVFLSLASSGDDADRWYISGDKVVYAAPITVTVDLSVPAAPTLDVADGEKAGTVQVTGNAAGATFVILTYENDFEEENDEGVLEPYTVKNIAAIFNPDEQGDFSVTLAKPGQSARISAVAVNAAGGMSDGAVNSVAGYTQPEEESSKTVDAFSSVTAQQVAGKRDATVTVTGAQITGLTLAGELYYRITDSQPNLVYPAKAEFDTAGWVNAGTGSTFTVKGVADGQYIEVVQVLRENVYTADESGHMTVTGTKHTALRCGAVAVSMEAVQGFAVSGTLIQNGVQTNLSGLNLILTDSADHTVSYTATVQVSDGVATYLFTDVLPGTYILGLDSAVQNIEADPVLLTVGQSDVVRNIEVEATWIPGDTDGDGVLGYGDIAAMNELLKVDGYDPAADLNSDGTVNILDMVRLKKMVPKEKGDINGDCAWDREDVIAMKNLLETDGYDPAADLNDDGVVNILDLVRLRNRIPKEKGDINGDFIWNQKDIASMNALLAVDGYDAAADLNDDGAVNILDLVLLQDMILTDNPIEKGDMDGNGILDVADLQTVQNILASGQYSAAADMNDDGVVDILDMVRLLRIITDDAQRKAADMDADGSLTETDIAAIQQVLMKGGNADINGDGVTDLLDLIRAKNLMASSVS